MERFDRLVDTYTQLVREHGVRVISVKPNGVRVRSGQVGGSMIGPPVSVIDRLRHEILRSLYRGKLHLTAARACRAN